MSLKYKIAAAIAALPLFFTVFFAPCLLIRASADGVNNNWWERLASAQYSNWSELPDNFKNLGEAYVNTFKSIGSKDFFSTAADVPISWYHILDDTTPVLSVGGQIFYYLDKSGNLKFTKKGSYGSGNSIEDNATLVDSRDKLAVDGKTFQKHIEKTNEEYSPKNTGKYISYRTDEWYKTKEENYCLLPLYNGGFCGERWSEIYLMPFYTDGDDRYYSEFQLHFYLERVDNENGDGWTTTFAVEWFSNFDDIEEKKGSYVIKEGMTSPEYIYLSSVIDSFQRIYLFSYPSLSNALERSHSGQFQKLINFNSDFMRYYKSGDLSTYITVNNTSNYFRYHFGYEYSKHDSSCLYGSLDDIGYYYSNTPIVISYTIDTTKIPDNYYITVGGDTIYDYNITNPSTGDTTTINNYITNNYTFITSPDNPDIGTGGGTVNNYYDGATIINGDNITNNYNFSDGDTNFFTEIGVSIQNALNFAFVPSDSYMDKFNSDLRNTLESKIPFVYDIGDIFNSLFVDIVDNNLVYASDINSDGSVDESSVIYPKWTFNVNFFGTDYELIYLDFSMYSSTFFYIRTVVACFTYLAFFVMLLKSLPSIIGNVGSLVSASYSVAPYVIERFSDVPKGGD